MFYKYKEQIFGVLFDKISFEFYMFLNKNIFSFLLANTFLYTTLHGIPPSP